MSLYTAGCAGVKVQVLVSPFMPRDSVAVMELNDGMLVASCDALTDDQLLSALARYYDKADAHRHTHAQALAAPAWAD